MNSVYDLSLMNTGTHLQKLEKESKAERKGHMAEHWRVQGGNETKLIAPEQSVT